MTSAGAQETLTFTLRLRDGEQFVNYIHEQFKRGELDKVVTAVYENLHVRLCGITRDMTFVMATTERWEDLRKCTEDLQMFLEKLLPPDVRGRVHWGGLRPCRAEDYDMALWCDSRGSRGSRMVVQRRAVEELRTELLSIANGLDLERIATTAGIASAGVSSGLLAGGLSLSGLAASLPAAFLLGPAGFVAGAAVGLAVHTAVSAHRSKVAVEVDKIIEKLDTNRAQVLLDKLRKTFGDTAAPIALDADWKTKCQKAVRVICEQGLSAGEDSLLEVRQMLVAGRGLPATISPPFVIFLCLDVKDILSSAMTGCPAQPGKMVRRLVEETLKQE